MTLFIKFIGEIIKKYAMKLQTVDMWGVLVEEVIIAKNEDDLSKNIWEYKRASRGTNKSSENQ